MPHVLIFASHDELYWLAAAYFRRLASRAVAERGQFHVVLCGGSTPAPLYQNLADSTAPQTIPWQRTHVWWGDERAVPPSHSGSNYGEAQELLLSYVPLLPEHVHRIKGELGPAAAAEDYAQELTNVASDSQLVPQFDLVLLGLGADGHTASLFPGTSLPGENEKVVVATEGEYEGRPAERVTLTPLAFGEARHIFFLVTGEEKAAAVAGTLQEDQDAARWPAQRINPRNGHITWFLDEPAAESLSDRE